MTTTPAMIKGAEATLVFAADTVAHQRVYINSSGQAAIAGVGKASVGTCVGYNVDVSENAYGAVGLDHQVGTKTFIAAAAITAGSLVYPAADGEVSATAIGAPIGIARTAATADQDLIEVIPIHAAVTPIEHTVGASEDTANEADIDTGLGNLLVNAIVQVHSAAGAERAGTTKTISAGVVTVANSNLAATDVITVIPIIDQRELTGS